MNTSTEASPGELRDRMIDKIVSSRPTSPAVEQAMRDVPRHRFVPKAGIEDAYADEAVITHRAADGTALSCASVPSLVAVMLDNLQVRPGDRILEIGAGTGYNAALLAHLTGPTGHVTTVDIDAEVTAEARIALDATGWPDVEVITGDGQLGDPDQRTYDRIIVTVGAWDIPTAWWNQLKIGGRLVVPLRWRGQTRVIAFVRDADRMRSDWGELCGFVPMIGQEGERSASIDPGGHVRLYWDADQPIDPAALDGVLTQPPTDVRSGVTVGPEDPIDGVWLRLATSEQGTCRVAADPTAVDTGLCTPAIPAHSPALVHRASLAYLTLHPGIDLDGERRWGLGARGHGPDGRELADRICGQIMSWNRDRDAQPAVLALPAGSGIETDSGSLTITRPCTRIIANY